MKTDITNRTDIEKLVNTFYLKIQQDDSISPFFNDVTRINRAAHLPKMYRFLENMLFYSGTYDGNPMEVHRELYRKSGNTIMPIHYHRWVALFHETVDQLFKGPKADEIKTRTSNIASIMIQKVLI